MCIRDSYWVALYFGLSPERFRLAAFETTPILALRVVLLAVLCAVVSILMCAVLHQTGKLFQSIFPNQYLRIVVGGSLICLDVYKRQGEKFAGRITPSSASSRS